MTEHGAAATLSVRDLVVARGSFRVGPLSVTVAPGESVALLGANGSGKSTLLLAILGLLPRDDGTVTVNGASVDPRHPPRGAGVILAWPGFYDWVSGRRNLRLAAEGDKGARDRIDALLAEVGLEHAANRSVRDYSTGMTKRLELARALLFDPTLLVLDEPTSGLDDAGRAWLARELEERRAEGRSVLLATHDSEFVEALDARVIRIAGHAHDRTASR